jgi:radical SAM protein with 4Fe4S-binding SPASM domain
MKIKLVDDPQRNHIGIQMSLLVGDCNCDCACPIDEPALPTLTRPVALYLELTPVCNNHCPGCGNFYASKRASVPAPLTGEEWCNLISQLLPQIRYLRITGGEPTLHPSFSRILAKLDRHNLPCTIFTNGRWTQPGDMVDLFSSTRVCNGLLVSLHGPDAVTHEAFSGVSGSFIETTKNIRRATNASVDVAVSLVLTKHNWNLITDTLSLALDLGANHLVCNRLIGNLPGLMPTRSELRTAVATVENLRALGHPVRFGNCIPQCFEASSSAGCTAGTTFATIDPWGRVRPCNHAPIIVGDLKTESLEDIWNSPTMERWRTLIPTSCATCATFGSCHGGCRAQALLSKVEKDPLIQAPLVTNSQEEEIRLWAGLRPVGSFTQHEEQGRMFLIHRSQVMQVPTALVNLPPMLDGALTLQQVSEIYGSVALDWVGTLVKAGMVTWQNAP